MSDVIHTLLECDSVSFGPEDIAKLVAGFESALTNLGLKERNDLPTIHTPSHVGGGHIPDTAYTACGADVQILH